MLRAKMSVPPPGGWGTTKRMGRLGKSWALAPVAHNSDAASAPKAVRRHICKGLLFMGDLLIKLV